MKGSEFKGSGFRVEVGVAGYACQIKCNQQLLNRKTFER